MKKYLIFIALITFMITQLSFALVIKQKSVPPYAPTSTPGEFGEKINTTSIPTSRPNGIEITERESSARISTTSISTDRPRLRNLPLIGDSFGRQVNTTSTATSPVKVKSYNACVGEKVKLLTKEMKNKKKQSLSKFKEAYKSATTTEAKKEIKKTYNQEQKDINRWFNQELRRIKQECK